VDDADDGRRPDRADRRRRRARTVMHQNVVDRRGDRALVLPARRTPARNRVVYERGNFPSVRYLYRGAADLDVVVCEDRRGDRRARSTSGRSRTDQPRPLQGLRRSRTSPRSSSGAHERWRHVILDCYQSVGAVPLDVTALEVDFAAGGSVKWLCGGPGARLALRAGPTSPSARADVHGLAGARAAVRVRARDSGTRRARSAS
jgi:kynureninase